MLEALPAIAHGAFSSHGRRNTPSDDRYSEYSAVSVLSIDDLDDQPGVPAAVEHKGFLRRHLHSALCFTLHLVLVLVHIAVLISAIRHWEHRFTFLIEHQTTVSFWTAVVTQSFGTIYSAVLVFLTQKLALQRRMGLKTLTAVHDSISAWAGLGSALATLFNQVYVPASVLGTLSIVGYLGCISVLHISIPAILSVEAFSRTASVAIPPVFRPYPQEVMGPEPNHSMSSSSLKLTKLPKLRDDGSNWGTYKDLVWNALIAKGLRRHVVGTARAPPELESRDGEFFLPPRLAPLSEAELEEHEDKVDEYLQKQAQVRQVI
ncbi:Retrovirus-related Pol polyprotein from transposon TNT 1-94 [Mycena venus]|uniref:Retrovirus-related Pol polyprotein from transposon TNT 1-94 n=1 Tax=Mycena venus TaxID=2733690 RepID=A0A8H7CT00_9AGAR|nr:Retrovirus-related Pol polyprotein from transposon TNT 1-94 [Mycena venus]